MKTALKKIFVGSIALILATTVWLPCLQFVFRCRPNQFHTQNGLSQKSQQLAARHIQLWTEPDLVQRELGKMRTR